MSTDASRLLREGEALVRKRDFRAARDALSQAVAMVPALAPAHSLLGRARHGLGDAGGAAESYRAALDLDPRDADAWRRFGNALLDLERPAEAADAFRRARALNPRDSGSVYGLGTALAEADDVEGAEAAFTEWGHLPPPASLDPHLHFAAIAGQIRLSDGFFAGLDTGPGPALDGSFAQGDAPLVFVAADAGYTARFVDLIAGNLAAQAPGIALHLHVVNPTAESEAKVARVADLTQGHLDLAVTRETVGLARYAAPGLDPLYAAKTYYSCARFLALPQLVAHYRRPILVCDIDLAPTRDPRPWLDELAPCDAGANVKIRYDFANRLLATMVYFGDTPAGRRYAGLVSAYCRHFLEDRTATWTIDQVALHAAWLHMRRQGQWNDFREFAPGTMNWMDDSFDAEEARRRFLFVSLYSSVPKAGG
ncbi:MAG: tetratricopeptide repeat protein [Rhodospirillales bacterium]|nr:tetratricopeptide repeat protein [Rhodospirillales bacterium]